MSCQNWWFQIAEIISSFSNFWNWRTAWCTNGSWKKKRLKANFLLVLCEMGMFWQIIRKGVWYHNTTRNFSFWVLLATLLISGKKIFVRNLSILSEYLSLWTQECDYFWLILIFMLQRSVRKKILSCYSAIDAEASSFHKGFARGAVAFLHECWGESIKKIYLIASWNAQFSIHFLDGRGWMVVQITLLHLQEVICLSATAKIILL